MTIRKSIFYIIATTILKAVRAGFARRRARYG
jgi:hypothetical protein